jgi:phosphatidylethanolamine-binding protein (PEBP) family uncharacterized protein
VTDFEKAQRRVIHDCRCEISEVHRCHGGVLIAADGISGVLRPPGSKYATDEHCVYCGVPCPPAGKAHRYYLKLYALDRVLELQPGATKKEIECARENHTLAQGQLMGTYKRK